MLTKRYTEGNDELDAMSKERLEHLLNLRADDFIIEAAERGEELNERIALARAVAEYKRNPRRWMQEWKRKGKKVQLF